MFAHVMACRWHYLASVGNSGPPTEEYIVGNQLSKNAIRRIAVSNRRKAIRIALELGLYDLASELDKVAAPG